MAGASLLTLLDDIASVLDDVATMTKVAAKKTAGVLGDDLALNAQQVSGVNADRELPVVWAVAKGSAINKVVLVPAALLVSAVAPWAVTPLLIAGGLFLCYEGVEKLLHGWLARRGHGHDGHRAHGAGAAPDARGTRARAAADPAADPVAFERDRIRGAVRTDFILSAEIIVIALGTVAQAPMGTRVAVLTAIALLMTVGVYGLVAAIVKLDDAGLAMSERGRTALGRAVGRGLLGLAPALMKTLSIAGTVAMFLVGGGILAHGVAPLHHAIEASAQAVQGVAGIGSALAAVLPTLLEALAGVAAGAAIVAALTLGRRVAGRG